MSVGIRQTVPEVPNGRAPSRRTGEASPFATRRLSRRLEARCRSGESQAAVGIQRDPLDAEPLSQESRHLGAASLGAPCRPPARALQKDGLFVYEQGETAVCGAATDEHAGHE